MRRWRRIRTRSSAPRRRPTPRGPFAPVPNGFRRMDLLTNEGRSWYQGVRIAVQHRTDAAHPHGVLHAIEVGGSVESLVLAGRQLRSRARSRPDRRRHAAQSGDQRHVECAGQRPGPERLAAQLGVASPERDALYDPLRRRSDRRWIDRRLQQPRMPVEPARRTQHGTRQVHQLRRHDAARERSPLDPTRSRFAPTCSTRSTTRTCSRAAIIGLVGNPRFGQHAGGANVFPGRQFQFAATYRF